MLLAKDTFFGIPPDSERGTSFSITLVSVYSKEAPTPIYLAAISLSVSYLILALTEKHLGYPSPLVCLLIVRWYCFEDILRQKLEFCLLPTVTKCWEFFLASEDGS